MIGVTISSPNYSEMTEESRKAFQKHTGLACHVIHTNNDHNYLAKLQLHRYFQQTIVFFDSDLRFIRDVDLHPYDNREEFFGVKDCSGHPLNAATFEESFSYKDCQNLKMNPNTYINGGFMIFNRKHHGVMMNDALNHIRQTPEDFADFGEQSAVNYQLQTSDVKLELLPVNYNVMVGGSASVESICSDPYAIHPAGMPYADKQGWFDEFS